jgi:hypothetical protein
MKKVLAFLACALLLAVPVMATEEIPQVATQAPAYNCDYKPSCEVAPGFYGKMASPVKSKFDLSIGGFVRLDYAYNSMNLGVNGFFLPGAPAGGIPAIGTAGYNTDQSEFTARVSRFWLKVAGPTFLGAKTGALIEADFVGLLSSGSTPAAINENGFLRMRHAYGTLDWANTQVLFGQYWDMFAPAAASTVDFRQGATFGTPNNPRVAQIRVTQKVNFNADNFLKLVVGLQNPTEDATTGATTGASGGDVPNVAAQIMFVSKALGVAPGFYGMSMNSLQAGFFGLWGREKVVTATLGNPNIDVYGYGFYAFVPILKSSDGKSRAMTASLEAQAYISAGMNWNGANASTTVADSTNATALNLVGRTAAKGYGVYGQIIFYPIQDLGITAGYDRRNAMNYRSFDIPTVTVAEQYNELIYGNVAYDLNAAVRFSTEYLHAKTQYAKPVGAGATKNFGQLNGVRVAAYYFF